jgi:hypothetical protein
MDHREEDIKSEDGLQMDDGKNSDGDYVNKDRKRILESVNLTSPDDRSGDSSIFRILSVPTKLSIE